jgi:hypothetical protein
LRQAQPSAESKARPHVEHRQGGPHQVVEGQGAGVGLAAAGHVGLVGDDHQGEARVGQAPGRLDHAGQQLELAGVRRRVRHAAAHEGAVNDAVAIQEYRPSQI